MQDKKQQIFDLKKELPSITSVEERDLVKALDEVSRKVALVLAQGQEFPEENVHHLLELTGQAQSSVRAGVVLGHIFMMLHEFAAMKDLYAGLIKNHGESHVLLFYQALAEEQLGANNNALVLYNKIIGSDCKNYYVYMQVAKLYRKEGSYSESTGLANLAVIENEHDSIEPFVLMAQNFKSTSEINRMLECFSRVEEMEGEAGLMSMGELYVENEGVYKSLKKMLK